MDITLINPPEQMRVWAGIPKAMAYGVYCFPPLGLMYIQASVESRTPYVAEIFDPVVDNLDYPDFEAQLKRYPLDLVGISAYTHSLPDVQMTINVVRKLNPNAKIVLGGPHCAMFPEYAIQLQDADAIITGDGEDAFVEIVEAHNAGRSFEGIEGVWFKQDGQTIKNRERKSTKSLDAYPWPDRSRTRYQEYYLPGTKAPLVTTAITSRGCPHSCPFCLTYKKQYRIRDIENILDEMEHCASLGITETHFIDDLFTPNSQWVLKFCDAIERRGLQFNWGYKTTIAGTTREQIRRCAETGCTKIHFGVESANNEGLDVWGKHCDTDDVHRVFKWCREEGVRSVAYIMLAGPHERTMDEALANLDEMLKLDAEYAVFAVFSPYPGTDSFEEGAKKGLYEPDCWDRMMKDPLCGVEVPAAWEEHLSRDEILELLKIAHRKFYLRPKFVARAVANLASAEEFKRLAGGAMSILKLELLKATSRTAPV
ncbi:MAG: B12-binding domain-containing radical SAM protein [Alphaproteobacteria bacterium]|nr:B12-binding domain-containing radical SAM protein [Alphaproteobacteria bacterium]MCB9791303.1 B12-binding domain-containing radical SAM protein [Alphaproteobacteria bacterium]